MFMLFKNEYANLSMSDPACKCDPVKQKRAFRLIKMIRIILIFKMIRKGTTQIQTNMTDGPCSLHLP